MKKIAYVHDWIVYPGGAESVLSNLINQYSGASSHRRIFTLFSLHQSFHNTQIITALPRWVNTFFGWTQEAKVPVLRSIFDYRNLIVIYPLLCRLLRKKIATYSPDQIIISSFAASKNIVPVAEWDYTTTLYLHSPNQYIRDNYEEYARKITGYKRWIFKSIVPILRRWDTRNRAYDYVLTNSYYTKSLAIQRYQIDSERITVQHPKLPAVIKNYSPVPHPDNYFLFIGRLVTFVREVDRIIALANTLQFPVLIMGDGPDREMLQAMAGETVTFLGQISDHDTKYEILRRARGLINLSLESCGIATMEALALGVPIFGYNAGGTAELVESGVTGLLVDSKDHQTLVEEFEKFQQINFERKKCIISS